MLCSKKGQKDLPKEIPTVVEETLPPPTEKKKSDDDFISYFSGISDSKHDYIPDKNAEGFSKDPPFTDFSTAYDPIADFLKEKETKKEEEAENVDEVLEETKTVIGIRFRTSTKTY